MLRPPPTGMALQGQSKLVAEVLTSLNAPTSGPKVAILLGFPEAGKTRCAAEVASQIDGRVVWMQSPWWKYNDEQNLGWDQEVGALCRAAAGASLVVWDDIDWLEKRLLDEALPLIGATGINASWLLVGSRPETVRKMAERLRETLLASVRQATVESFILQLLSQESLANLASQFAELFGRSEALPVTTSWTPVQVRERARSQRLSADIGTWEAGWNAFSSVAQSILLDLAAREAFDPTLVPAYWAELSLAGWIGWRKEATWLHHGAWDFVRHKLLEEFQSPVEHDTLVPISIGALEFQADDEVGAIQVGKPPDSIERNFPSRMGVADEVQRLQRALRSARALSEVARAVAGTMELGELASVLLRQCLRVTRAERGLILMGSDLHPLAQEERSSSGGEMPDHAFSQSIARQVFESGKAVAAIDAPENFSTNESVLELGIQSVLCVPLVAKDENLGVVYVASHLNRVSFGPEELSILEAIAAQAALSINNAKLFNNLVDTLQRERAALRDKANMARYMSATALEAAESTREAEVNRNGSLVLASVLFADIRGFTSISERMDPRGIVSLLNDYLTRMDYIITKRGGVLDKIMGDGIMAVFFPKQDTGPDDDATASAKAALEMQSAVAAMNREAENAGRPRIEIGVGIARGTVLLGNIGSTNRMDFTVIGDTVNLASRLESNAKPGKILMSAAAARAVRDGISLTDVGPIAVKGIAEPLAVFCVMSRD